ncbi:hypothetical protein WJX72_010344 [[Myrmecia] bisecta]|uniref:Uncharacterized protein n=1 Tax=[Myrmecia] bisecta TaxID=41462 RepID=A0AAW1P4B7_9CHLO
MHLYDLWQNIIRQGKKGGGVRERLRKLKAKHSGHENTSAPREAGEEDGQDEEDLWLSPPKRLKASSGGRAWPAAVSAAVIEAEGDSRAADEDDLFAEDAFSEPPALGEGRAAGKRKAAASGARVSAPARQKKTTGDRGGTSTSAQGAQPMQGLYPDAPSASGSFSAQPNLGNAPLHGPDEPLILVDNESVLNGGRPLRLQVPASINKYLREYQREGVRFLFRNYAEGKGAILADDMGLGKTVQTIAFCAALLGKTGTAADLEGPSQAGNRRAPILIVAPSSVLANWQREFWTWGAFKVGRFEGRAKAQVLAECESGACEVMLASDAMFRGNIDDINEVAWHAVVVDEAHHLKNANSMIYQAAWSLKTKLRYGLSGTVMSNKYSELHALLSWAVPHCLGEWGKFREYYVDPLQAGQSSEATEYHIAKAEDRKHRLQGHLLRVMLRRSKKGTIADQLPNKKDNIVFCELAPMQLAAYKRFLDSEDCKQLLQSNDPCDCGSGVAWTTCCHLPEDSGGVLWRQLHCCECDNPFDPVTNPKGCKWHKPQGCRAAGGGTDENGERHGGMSCPNCLILPSLTILQKISNHLELIKADPEELKNDPFKLERQKEVAAMVLGEDLELAGGPTTNCDFLSVSNSDNCGKMLALEKLLELWKGKGNKVLIFSHSVKMLKIIKSMVERKGYSAEYLDGSTPVKDRQPKVDRFNDSPSLFLFLISTTAGGLGLNLTSANKVVIVDPSWNPAHDLQAQDRAFRIGQRRDMNVYRLVAAGTLEEMVYKRQIYKQQQSEIAVNASSERRYFAGIQGKRGAQGELWGIANLLKLTADRVDTCEIVDAHRRNELEIEEWNPDPAPAGDGVGATLEAAPAGIDVDDAGLSVLAQQLAAAETAAGAAQRSAAGAAGGGDADTEQELRQLEDANMMAIYEHDGIMGALAQWKGLSLEAMAEQLLAMDKDGRDGLRQEYAAHHLQKQVA